MDVKIGIDAQRLLTAFSIAPDNMRNGMRLAMKRAINETISVARSKESHRFTSRSHNLERSIDGKVVSSDPLIGMVAAGGKNAPYGIYVHDGTPRHLIRVNPQGRMGKKPGSTRPGTLSFAVGGRMMFRREVMHPGTKEDPFLYNAANKLGGTGRYSQIFANAISKVLGGLGLK